MIAKIRKGQRMIGLVAYLAGPGRSNEHSDIHLVSSSDVVVSVGQGADLTAENTMRLAHELNAPKKAHFPNDHRRDHVFHVSLSLDAAEGLQSDDFWATVVSEFMTDMELSGDDGKAPCRWAAIRHGVSGNGNDHVHIAVSMIREDGTWWNANRDFVRAQRACRSIERRHGLRVLADGVKTRGFAEGELQSMARRRAVAKYTKAAVKDPSMVPWSMLDKAAREHLVKDQLTAEQPRQEIALKVRAAGAGARTEASFVRRLRGHGLLVRPYYAKGSTTAVAGYSVAMRPLHGERPIWYGGGTLAKDLTLPALRQGWEPGNQGAAATPEWAAAKRNKPFAGKEPEALSGPVLNEYFKEISEHLNTLSQVNLQDPVEFAKIAREGAGLFAAWAVAAGAEGEESAAALRKSADLFARHAQLSERASRAVQPPSMVYADLCAHQAISLSRRAGAVAVVRAWTTLGDKLGGGFAAHGWAQRSEVLCRDLKTRLDGVHDAYRVVNPLTPAHGTGSPTAQPKDAAAHTAVVATTGRPAVDRASTIEALKARLRGEGVPESAIAARVFAESQTAAGKPGRTPGTPPVTPAVTKQNPHQPQRPRRGPEEGMNR